MDQETNEMLRRLFGITEHDQTAINRAIVRNTEAVFMKFLDREINRVAGTDQEIDIDALFNKALKIGTHVATGEIEKKLL